MLRGDAILTERHWAYFEIIALSLTKGSWKFANIRSPILPQRRPHNETSAYGTRQIVATVRLQSQQLAKANHLHSEETHPLEAVNSIFR